MGDTDGRDLPALLLKLAVFPVLIKRISVPLPNHFRGGNVPALASVKGLLWEVLLLALQDPRCSDRYIDRPALTRCMEQHHCVNPAHMFYIRDTNCSGMTNGDLVKSTR